MKDLGAGEGCNKWLDYGNKSPSVGDIININ